MKTETQNKEQFIKSADLKFSSKKFISESKKVSLFQSIVYDYYQLFGRPFSWRNTTEPYKILVSEIMLQQTQTKRVESKFENFISYFPDIFSLARADLHSVLMLWQGLGYNRRGKYLHEIAKTVVENFDGNIPACERTLQSFPGIGAATAASICAFAFNMPTVFVETNVRTVFTHFFFKENKKIRDSEVLELVALFLDWKNPRKWYYALTDYGVGLKKIYRNINEKSAHYVRQSRFQGSDRQIRGAIIRIILDQKVVTEKKLVVLLNEDSERIKKIINQLIAENFICKKKGKLEIA